MTKTYPGTWEPTEWMRRVLARAERATSLAAANHGDPTRLAVVAPAGGATMPGSREDRTCDRCGVFVSLALKDAFFGVVVRGIGERGTQILVPAGLCQRCYDAEGIPGYPLNAA